ncbi:undecaprenyl-diphosphate phosphatase [Haladaptatus salinisoli]|uniref:undecaprenyl-diphosphate phosphatase n=1 Tax=Haladaptatus salinisoli TaxID=2884876 RepID=UPI001D0B8277|nr:undecaprenyl-diphosphate phosphatase [Haladaptatus salinisoli]
MVDRSLLIALLAGVLQGIFEWLPISSEGNITLFLTAVGTAPEAAVRFSLFLHAGTAIAAAVYYRGELEDVLRELPRWRPPSAFEGDRAELTFLAVATVVSGVVGLLAYFTLYKIVPTLAGGGFVALIGVLLIGTGVLLRTVDSLDMGGRESPDLLDAVLVGAMQGIAIIPGVSRSGTTASALLFRGHDGPSAFRLSFLLSIPAAAGAGVLVVLDTGSLPAVEPGAAAVALAASAVVGYLTIDALMRVVERVSFWAVCIGLGSLAVLGGAFLLVA